VCGNAADKKVEAILIAVKYMGAVGLGATAPQVFRANDDQVYIVKLQNNKMGRKVLVNEFLASRIGQLMGLCFPPSGIIRLDEEVIQKNRWLRAAKVSAGMHFASQYLNHTWYVDRRNLNKATNKVEMAGVMLFDHMFHNVDRTWNRKNLLLRREAGSYRLYAIDHSHLFRKGKWTVEWLAKLNTDMTVNSTRSFGWLLKYFLKKEDFAPYIAKVQQMTDGQLNELVMDIPNEWLPDEAERQALLDYLVKRRDLTEEIAEKICALIPNVHRRSHIH
jgi:hypothetical protein